MMNMRSCLRMAVIAGCALSVSGAVAAQPADFPPQRTTMIVAFPPGGGLDNVCRLIANGLTRKIGYPVIVENRPGAAGNIGTAAGVRAAADGSTLICIPHSTIQGGHLYANLPFDVLKDLKPVSYIGSVDWFFMVRKDSKFGSINDLVTAGRASPGLITVGETGTSAKLITSLLESMSGAKFLHVPYKGGAPALTAVLGGQIDLGMQNFEIASAQVKAGTLRAIGVASKKRSSYLPDVPAVGEILPGYDAPGWYGIVAPGSTPHEIAKKWHAEIAAVLNTPEIRQRLASSGMEIGASGPDEFADMIRSEYDKWGQVIRKFGIKAD